MVSQEEYSFGRLDRGEEEWTASSQAPRIRMEKERVVRKQEDKIVGTYKNSPVARA